MNTSTVVAIVVVVIVVVAVVALLVLRARRQQAAQHPSSAGEVDQSPSGLGVHQSDAAARTAKAEAREAHAAEQVDPAATGSPAAPDPDGPSPRRADLGDTPAAPDQPGQGGPRS